MEVLRPEMSHPRRSTQTLFEFGHHRASGLRLPDALFVQSVRRELAHMPQPCQMGNDSEIVRCGVLHSSLKPRPVAHETLQEVSVPDGRRLVAEPALPESE